MTTLLFEASPFSEQPLVAKSLPFFVSSRYLVSNWQHRPVSLEQKAEGESEDKNGEKKIPSTEHKEASGMVSKRSFFFIGCIVKVRAY